MAANISLPHQLTLPFLGLLDDDSMAMTAWSNKLLEPLNRPPRRRRVKTVEKAAVSSATSSRYLPGNREEERNPDESQGEYDEVVNGHRPAISESRMHHMQEVRAKLERANEANRQAERNRHAIHDSIRSEVNCLSLPTTGDIRKLDKWNYAHPLANQQLERSAVLQRQREEGYHSYLESTRVIRQ